MYDATQLCIGKRSTQIVSQTKGFQCNRVWRDENVFVVMRTGNNVPGTSKGHHRDQDIMMSIDSTL